MKLMVQIPCLNEEATLPSTLKDIPEAIDGIDEIEIVVIDDGSVDRTSEVARACGVDHVIRFAGNRGLGHAFSTGIDFCLREGADIIVNTDGDNQYNGADIALLVEPILEGRAELVIGDRQVGALEQFSSTKRRLQVLGSEIVSRLANIEVPDVASGFRAYSREAASRLNMLTDFDHTVDHVIQAGRKRVPTVSVPIRTNVKMRDSRLFSGIGEFITRSLGIMVRVYSSYGGAMRVFTSFGIVALLAGFLLGIRFLYYYFFTDTAELHVQSLILAAILTLAGFQMVLTGIVADLINSSRTILEDVSYRLRRMENTPRREAESDRQNERGDAAK
jgi:glycosyltransferase involved in cell wall biosynthesis